MALMRQIISLPRFPYQPIVAADDHGRVSVQATTSRVACPMSARMRVETRKNGCFSEPTQVALRHSKHKQAKATQHAGCALNVDRCRMVRVFVKVRGTQNTER